MIPLIVEQGGLGEERRVIRAEADNVELGAKGK